MLSLRNSRQEERDVAEIKFISINDKANYSRDKVIDILNIVYYKTG
jgi:hypothetical protein